MRYLETKFKERASGLLFTLVEYLHVHHEWAGDKGIQETCYFFTSEDEKCNSQHFSEKENAIKAMEEKYLLFSDNPDLCSRCTHA